MAQPGYGWRSRAGARTEKGDPDIMQHPPRPSDEPIINKFMLKGIIVQTIANHSYDSGCLPALAAAHSRELRKKARVLSRTFAFITLSLSELFRAYHCPFQNNFPSDQDWHFTNKKHEHCRPGFGCPGNHGYLCCHSYKQCLTRLPCAGSIGWRFLPLVLIPSIAAEVMKAITYKKNLARLASLED